MRISSHFLLQVPQAHSLARSSRVQSHAPGLSEKNLLTWKNRSCKKGSGASSKCRKCALLSHKKNYCIRKTLKFSKRMSFINLWDISYIAFTIHWWFFPRGCLIVYKILCSSSFFRCLVWLLGEIHFICPSVGACGKFWMTRFTTWSHEVFKF